MKNPPSSFGPRRFTATILAIFFLTACGIAAPPQYTVLDLGAQLFNVSRATGVNDVGMVTGYGQFENGGPVHAFLYSGGVMHDLGSIEGTMSFGYSINVHGQVAGNYEPASLAGDLPFLASSTAFTPLPTLDGMRGEATAINDAGDAVGTSYLPNGGPSRAVLYRNGNAIDLGTLGGRASDTSIGSAINNRGQVTGYSSTASNQGRAFLTIGGVMTDLGSLGGVSSIGVDVNDSGVVAGHSMLANSTDYHATRWAGGQILDLGTLGGTISYSDSVNNAGQIVGSSRYSAGDATHGFLWSDGVMYDLNSLVPADSGVTGIDLEDGTSAINSLGQIAAFGSVNGVNHALLLTPVGVPEPGVGSLLIVFGGLFLGRRPRKGWREGDGIRRR